MGYLVIDIFFYSGKKRAVIVSDDENVFVTRYVLGIFLNLCQLYIDFNSVLFMTVLRRPLLKNRLLLPRKSKMLVVSWYLTRLCMFNLNFS